jgi:hypothetical protein
LISCLTYSFLVLLCNFYAWQSSDPAGSQKPRGQPRFERAESVYLTYSFPVRRFRFLHLGCPYSLCWTSTDFLVSETPRQQIANYRSPLLSHNEPVRRAGSSTFGTDDSLRDPESCLVSRQRSRLEFPVECGSFRLTRREMGDVSLADRCVDPNNSLPLSLVG